MRQTSRVTFAPAMTSNPSDGLERGHEIVMHSPPVLFFASTPGRSDSPTDGEVGNFMHQGLDDGGFSLKSSSGNTDFGDAADLSVAPAISSANNALFRPISINITSADCRPNGHASSESDVLYCSSPLTVQKAAFAANQSV